ncbi:MAG: hypothetical protein AAB926_01875 [Patescibacteria group bacterium]
MKKLLMYACAVVAAVVIGMATTPVQAVNDAGIFDNPVAGAASIVGTSGSFTIYKEAITDNARNEGRRNTQAVSLGGADAVVNSIYDCKVTYGGCTKEALLKDTGVNLMVRVPVVYGLSTIRSSGAGVWPPLVGLVVDAIDEFGINRWAYSR